MSDPLKDPSEKSLIAELLDGSAGWGLRLIMSFASAPAFAGACGVMVHLIAAMFPQHNRGGGAGVRPDDEMAGFVFGGGALLYLLFLAWLWSRGKTGPGRVVLFASVGTIFTTVLVAIIGVWIEQVVNGDEGFLIAADVLFGMFAVIMMWLHAYRKFGRGRPKINSSDGTFDVRCPTCEYRMVGLSESLCPECGTQFTLDELLGAQDFRKTDMRTTPRRATSLKKDLSLTSHETKAS